MSEPTTNTVPPTSRVLLDMDEDDFLFLVDDVNDNNGNIQWMLNARKSLRDLQPTIQATGTDREKRKN
jgi:hypothetical protein